mmetsp:Transcript_83109/g.131470  ORF Transcript_83109/g.131470 Transcript_83109/m.131470 type:complete len:292 (+) Transcript_83109:562-1437(+)
MLHIHFRFCFNFRFCFKILRILRVLQIWWTCFHRHLQHRLRCISFAACRQLPRLWFRLWRGSLAVPSWDLLGDHWRSWSSEIIFRGCAGRWRTARDSTWISRSCGVIGVILCLTYSRWILGCSFCFGEKLGAGDVHGTDLRCAQQLPPVLLLDLPNVGQLQYLKYLAALCCWHGDETCWYWIGFVSVLVMLISSMQGIKILQMLDHRGFVQMSWEVHATNLKEFSQLQRGKVPEGLPPSPSALPQLGGCQVGMSTAWQPRQGATNLLQALPDPKEILLCRGHDSGFRWMPN